MKRIVILFCLVLVVAFEIKAQNKCHEAYEAAQTLFAEGNYDESAKKALEAVQCDLTDAEKEEAQVLLAKTYIELDRIEEADNVIRKLLRTNPNFKFREGAQMEDFNKQVKQYKVIPLFSVGVKAAANYSFFPITKTFSILDSVNYDAPYQAGIGYSVGGKLEIEPIKNLSLNIEVLSTVIGYERVLKKPTEWDMKYSEDLSYLELPMYLKKSFTIKDKIFPYITLGGGLLNLTRSTANISILYKATDPLTHIKDEYKLAQNNINQKDLRTATLYEWLIGTGVTYKVNNFRYSCEVRYYNSLSNIMNPSKRYGNAELIYHYNYIDNNILLEKLEFSFSVSYTFMHAIKKMKDAKN